MPRRLAYSLTTITSNGKYLLDLMKDQSVNFSKNHQYTTDDGHLKGVLCDITVRYDGSTTTGVPFSILGLRNTWKLRNAVRKFHFLRNHMFREAGVSRSEMGTYGKTIRPYLDAKHANTVTGPSSDETVEMSSVVQVWTPNESDPEGSAGQFKETDAADKVGAGYWARTKFGTVPSYTAPASGAGPEGTLGPVDEWTC